MESQGALSACRCVSVSGSVCLWPEQDREKDGWEATTNSVTCLGKEKSEQNSPKLKRERNREAVTVKTKTKTRKALKSKGRKKYKGEEGGGSGPHLRALSPEFLNSSAPSERHP